MTANALVFDQSLRVRYADTDQMQFVYYGKYAEYFETARTEMIRSWGLSYREMEARGVWMPVSDYEIKFIRPARYDELLRVRCIVDEMPMMRLTIHSEVYNEAEELVAKGRVRLAFMDAQTQRPVRLPGFLKEILIANGLEE